MKKELLVLWVTGILIFLSSCASSHGNLSKAELAKVIHAKIDSREYRIDLIPSPCVSEGGTVLYIPEYLQVCGDSIISCMIHDNPYPGDFPPKGYVENMKGVKYEIFDYQQTKTRRGRRIVSFWFKVKYEGYDPYILAASKDRGVQLHYKFEFGNSTKVRVLQGEYLRFGTLSL